MFLFIGNCQLELTQGDITRQQVDALVNAANEQLIAGGGVDGAIHKSAGPALQAELSQKYPGGCATGQAVVTSGGQLPVKMIFHAVGPVWRGGQQGEPALLASVFRICLELAIAHRCASIAFPAISTGIYGYPKDLAAETALTTARDFLLTQGGPPLVRFVLFDGGTLGAFARVLELLAD